MLVTSEPFIIKLNKNSYMLTKRISKIVPCNIEIDKLFYCKYL